MFSSALETSAHKLVPAKTPKVDDGNSGGRETGTITRSGNNTNLKSTILFISVLHPK
jgi:hypothetical protein